MPDDTAALQQALADQLVREGVITTARVEAAFRAVPRHPFLPEVPVEQVYRDEAIITKRRDGGEPISSSSQPAIMAIMLEQLDLHPGRRVLEVGAGTGYNAALMAHIVGDTGQVTTVDIDQDIVDSARAHLAAAGYERVRVVCGDGGAGYPPAAPYDRIILTVGAWDIAPAWREQLRPGGRLLLPLSLRGVQLAVAFEQTGGRLASVSVKDCGFMRLRGAFAGPEGVVRLGPDPGLSLIADDRAVDAAAAYRLLTGPRRELPVGVRVTPREVFGGLALWLALREPGYLSLCAAGEPAGRGDVPCLFQFSGECCSRGVYDGTGLCALARPPQRPFPVPEQAELPFELFVRSYGPDDALAHRVIGHIAAWDRAGRPTSESLRIRVYPREARFTPAAGETIIRKRWTDLVLDWP